MVYIIKDPETYLVKIGYSASPERRLASLRWKHGRGLHILFVKDGDRREEARLHAAFSHCRVHGEWFNWDPAMLDELKKEVELPKKQSFFLPHVKIPTELHAWLCAKALQEKRSTTQQLIWELERMAAAEKE